MKPWHLPRKYAPVDEVAVGDVVDWSGRPRRVLAVTRKRDDSVWYLTLNMVGRSPYPNDYTTYTRSDSYGRFRGIIKRASLAVGVDVEAETDVE